MGLPASDTTFGRGTRDKLAGDSAVATVGPGGTRGVFYNDGVTSNAATSDVGFMPSSP